MCCKHSNTVKLNWCVNDRSYWWQAYVKSVLQFESSTIIFPHKYGGFSDYCGCDAAVGGLDRYISM